MPAIDHLECAHCHHAAPPESADAACTLCAGPLLIRYDMQALAQTARREQVASRAVTSVASPGIWRYADVLPEMEPVTLGEGGTPLLRGRRHPNLFTKQEGANPTGSAHARGFALAAAMAKGSGVRHLALAGGGDAGVPLAAYAAAAGLSAHLFMPRSISFHHYVEATAYGATVTLVAGTLLDCARALDEAMRDPTGSASDRWRNLSTGREAFRLEGMKTLGYELAEQLGWSFPAAILYPTADSTGLLALRKAFEEMKQLGWVFGNCPRLYAVRTAEDEDTAAGEFFETITIAAKAGLEKTLDWATQEGVLLSPEGTAGIAAYAQLLVAGTLSPSSQVVLIHPGASLRNANELAKALHLRRPIQLPTSAKVGGIITPI